MIRAGLAILVVAVMGGAILGIGMGESAAEREQAPSAAQVAASEQRIAAGGAQVQRGRRLFTDEGCDRCHALAATGANGQLGPRLDTLDEDLDDNLESIVDPHDDTADGYPEKLMPDFGDLLDDRDIRALAAFVTTASGGEDEGERDQGENRGRGHNRGRGGGASGDG